MQDATDEMLYGSLDVTRHGSDSDSFTVIFIPDAAKEVSAPGHSVEDAEALHVFLGSLGLLERAIQTLIQGLRTSQRYQIRTLASAALLKQYHLV